MDWLKAVEISLETSVREAASCAETAAERLSEVFLRRLPPAVRHRMLESLDRVPASFQKVRQGPPADRSIGYPEFVMRAEHTLGVFEHDWSEDAGARLADHFLYALGQSVPESVVDDLLDEIPAELMQRMQVSTHVARRRTA